jgi:ethanolamine utilization protein EutQ (cupin superfamily)
MSTARIEVIESPTRVEAVGTPPKLISEFVGAVNTATDDVSIAVMQSPPGWAEPGQTPEFDEYSLVIDGELVVEGGPEPVTVKAGQVVYAPKGVWVRYSTPAGARYVAICRPAFTPDRVHRDA